jgi:protein-S-isoprenylcysteine O-methyltransferase Ste14
VEIYSEVSAGQMRGFRARPDTGYTPAIGEKCMTAKLATDLLWIVWYITWIAAVAWSAKTKVQMKTDMFGLHRFLLSVGMLLILVMPRAGGPLFGIPFTTALTQQWWTAPIWMEWAFFVLVAAGFAFCWWARLHLGRLWSGFVTLKEGHRVIDTGPYALVRHPIYSGIIFAALMTALQRANLLALAGFACMTVGLSMTARIEEGFIRAQLGAETYDAYARRVKMLVPFVG